MIDTHHFSTRYPHPASTQPGGYPHPIDGYLSYSQGGATHTGTHDAALPETKYKAGAPPRPLTAVWLLLLRLTTLLVLLGFAGYLGLILWAMIK